MTQEQLSMQNRDLDSLSLRNQLLHDQQTRLDIDRQGVINELAVTKSDLDQLRNEAANLRAEKKIWEVCLYSLGVEPPSLMTHFVRASKLASLKRTRTSLESVRSSQILWPASRECTMISNARERTIADASRRKCR